MIEIGQESDSDNYPLVILGIPFSNMYLLNTVDECLQIIQKNKDEKKISYLSLIDEFLILKSFGWLPTSIDSFELLSILRQAEISMMRGKTLRFIGRLLGSTIAPSSNPYELLLALCQALGEKEKGIFILGGIEKETKNAAITLHDKFNRLRLVGIATPPVFIDGEDLINSNARDNLLIEQINSSNADVLIVNLGMTKSELWIERVRHHLRIPFIVNVDSALNKVGKVQPLSNKFSWKRKNIPTESFFREKKIFTFFNYLKLIVMSLPLILYHNLSRFLFNAFYAKKELNKIHSHLFLSANRSIAVIFLPAFIGPPNAQLLKQRLEDAQSHDVLIFDFRNVCHIQPEGFYLLIKTLLQRQKRNKEIYGFCPSNDIIWLMKLHRTWDLFENTICDSAEILMERLKSKEGTTFYDTFTQTENLVTISLLGALDNRIDYDNYLKKIIPIIGQKNCCIDFSFCTFIDNKGFAFLLNLRKYILSQQNRLTLSSVNKNLIKQFRTTSIDEFFIFAPCDKSS